MNGVDPMATKYASLTPYNFSFNDPVTFTDPSGADPEYPYQPYMGGQGGFYGYGSYYTYDDYIPQRDLGAFIPAVDKGRTGYRPFGHSMNFGLSESSVDFIKQMRADRFHLSDLQFIATYGMEVEIWEHGKDYKSANDNSWQFHREYYYFKAVGVPEQSQMGTFTYLIGGADLLSEGISNTTATIANAVNGTAYNVHIANVNFLASKVASDIKSNYVSGQKVNIYGYSEGGNIALKVVRLLEVTKIPVSILFTVDAADGFDDQNPMVNRTIGANVLVNYNFYQMDSSTSPLRSHGGPNTGPGTIFNVNVTGPGVTHGNIDELMLNYAIMTLRK
jgi:hypothetical protein